MCRYLPRSSSLGIWRELCVELLYLAEITPEFCCCWVVRTEYGFAYLQRAFVDFFSFVQLAEVLEHRAEIVERRTDRGVVRAKCCFSNCQRTFKEGLGLLELAELLEH